MAVLRDTIVHGIIASIDGYQISEQRKNLASVHNGVLTFGDPEYSTCIKGIDLETIHTGSASQTVTEDIDIKSLTGDIVIDAKTGSIVINAKKAITIISENSGYNFNVYGDISENSANGGKSTILSGNIITKTTDGKYELIVTKDITIKSSEGGYYITTEGNNYQRADEAMTRSARTYITDMSSEGGYSLNVSKVISQKSIEEGYELDVKGDINLKSTTGGYSLDVKENIYQHTDNGDITVTTLNGDYTVGTERENAIVTAGKYLVLDAPRIKVKQSQGIYGTTDPNDLVLEDLEEGMLYFKIVD